MLETSDHEINVDQLMHEIRERAARERAEGNNRSSSSSYSMRADALAASAHPCADSSALNLQPEFHPRPDNEYHVNDLLQYHGGDFVRNAYRAILKREPDPAGLAQHLRNLASGRFNKIDILASLRFSPEGERARVKISGLKWPAAVRRIGRAPLIGYIIQTAIALARLPRLLQHQRQSEFYLAAQQQQIVDHSNQIHKQLTENLAQVAAQTSEGVGKVASQQQAIELLENQQREAAARVAEFRENVEARLATVNQQIEQGRAETEAQIKQLLGRQQELAARIEQSAALLTRQLEEQANISAATLARELEQLLRKQQQIMTELVMQERRLTLLLEQADEQSSQGDSSLAQLMAKEEDHLLDALYASFEDQFRGEREEIKNRLRVYLPVLKDAGITDSVLDIGCGRGEWLELLREEGIRGRGLDHNRVFAERCRQIGLDVAEADAIAYLRSLPDESLKVITSFHLVEHLPFEILIKFFDECVRTLSADGLLILETPDPENFMVGSCNFYADPTHRNPIPSETLKFLLEARGLNRVQVMKLRPWDEAKIKGDAEIIKRFNEYFYSAPDYGIIGWKP